MNMKEDCRQKIALVKESAYSPEAAYVSRTRLRRLILACNRMIARKYGLPDPILPGPFETPESASDSSADLVQCCNRLAGSANTLCQPSEPLDPRWKTEWAIVQADLDHLDKLLTHL